jgi:hypothetical protein
MDRLAVFIAASLQPFQPGIGVLLEGRPVSVVPSVHLEQRGVMAAGHAAAAPGSDHRWLRRAD